MAVTFLEKCTGLNTVDDHDTIGPSELAYAKDVVISDNGRVDRADGNALAVALTDGHSLFCDKFDCLVADGNGLISVGHDYSLLSLATGLSGDKLSYDQYGPAVYYANGTDLGIVENGIHYGWTADELPDEESLIFYEPTVPQFEHISIHAGQMFGSIGRALFVSEPGYFGLYQAKRAYLFGSDIIGHMSVDSGVFVSTLKETIFLRGTTPENFMEKQVAGYPMYPHSAFKTEADQAGFQGDGSCWLWNSPEGPCAGLSDGSFVNLTAKKVVYPSTGQYAASILRGRHFISTIDSSFSTDTNLNINGVDSGGNVIAGAKATTQRSYDFNSYARRGNVFLGCKPGGIYTLGGNTLAGSNINAALETRTWDADHEGEKRLRMIYANLYTQGNLTATPYFDDVAATAKTIVPPKTGIQQIRRKMGRGSKGDFLKLRIENVAGCDFSVNKLQVLIDPLSRAKG